jgi:putative endonuclease
MMNARQKLARWGEDFAAIYLEERGYHVLERNARSAYGEIDLVTTVAAPAMSKAMNEQQSRRVTVFVEVKTRSSVAYGYPEDSITRQKRAHMLAAAQAYLQAHPELAGDWRLDVIAIYRPVPEQPATINHFENVIREE